MSDATIGDNSSITRDQRIALNGYVQEIERIADERQELADETLEIYAAVKQNGFNVPAIRAIVKMRREDHAKRAAHDALVETYMLALGMLADTPLGAAAVKRDLPPVAKLPAVDTSNPPFNATDEPRRADPS